MAGRTAKNGKGTGEIPQTGRRKEKNGASENREGEHNSREKEDRGCGADAAEGGRKGLSKLKNKL